MAGVIKTLIQYVDNVKGLNPFDIKEELLLKQIVSTHVPSDTKLDVDVDVDVHSLFITVENIITNSTKIIDDFVLGKEISFEHLDDKSPPPGFSSPLCILKQIAHEMSCKDPKEEIAHETAISILNILKSHGWEAKAVLTLAAFALECGEFWLLSQLQPKNPLAKSVAILKRVPVLTKPKNREAIIEINNLIKASLQVIKNIFELERLSKLYYVPALEPAIEEKPFFAYWVIITIVAIVTQVDCLIKDSDNRLDLSHFGQKIKTIQRKFSDHQSKWRWEIEVAEYHKKVTSMFQSRTEIVQVLKLLFFWKATPKTPFYDGFTKSWVEIDVLKEKNVFLFISTLNITKEEIDLLKLIHEKTKTENKHKIVWVPFVKEEWNAKLEKKFKDLKDMMPWYVLHDFGNKPGFNYIEENWHFKKNPMVVHVDSQGKVLHQDAFHMIQVWKSDAFPLTFDVQSSLAQKDWFDILAGDIKPQIKKLIEDKKTYIFFYGGNDNEWIKKFTNYANALSGDLAKDHATEATKICIELFCVETEDKSIISRFWRAIESLLVIMMKMTSNAVSREVQKMLSYKSEKGWALLCKGSTVLVTGHGNTILKTLEDYEKQWKQFVISKGFEKSFMEYHEKIVRANSRCSHFEIPNVAGKIPDSMECAVCHQVMDVFISYRCCHKGGPA